MIARLQKDAQNISDELTGKAKLIHLEVLLAHSKDIGDPDELLDFCLSALATMKCSIDAARLGRQGRLIEKALKKLLAHDCVDLRSIMFERLGELDSELFNSWKLWAGGAGRELWARSAGFPLKLDDWGWKKKGGKTDGKGVSGIAGWKLKPKKNAPVTNGVNPPCDLSPLIRAAA